MQPSGGRVYIPLSRKVEFFTRMQPENSIFKVRSHFRELKKKAYEPEIIAIGPYHHGNEKLSMMEEHKLRYLHDLLRRKNSLSVDRYIAAIRRHEGKVRNFYAEPLSLTSEELVEMMVLDVCFIIELLRTCHLPHFRDPNDTIFKVIWMQNSLQRDLILFENQLPFIVLHELFGTVEEPDDQSFVHLLLNFFCWILPDPQHRWRDGPEYSLDTVKHLLDFVHINWLPPIIPRYSTSDHEDDTCFPKLTHFILQINDGTPDDDITKNSGDGRFIRCATELREAGVKFEKIEGDSLFDISFTQGTLKIPTLIIEDRTETFLRNLIAHEQYCDPRLPMPVTEYARFMDCLINSSKDVEILSHHGIIASFLGDDEVVSDIFNKMTDSISLPPTPSRYADTVKNLNSHYIRHISQINKRRHRWMNILRHDYFNSPWAIISFVAAGVLLILTAIQTTFTVFPRN